MVFYINSYVNYFNFILLFSYVLMYLYVCMLYTKKKILYFPSLFILEEFLLDDTKSYTFLSNGHIQVPGVDEVLEFRNTCNAMSIMGLSPDDLKGM